MNEIFFFRAADKKVFFEIYVFTEKIFFFLDGLLGIEMRFTAWFDSMPVFPTPACFFRIICEIAFAFATKIYYVKKQKKKKKKNQC